MEQKMEVKIPTVGRVVHYFPGSTEHDAVCRINNPEVLPADVVQVFGSNINLSVKTFNHDAPVVLRSSIPHKSTVTKGFAGGTWDWPPIK